MRLKRSRVKTYFLRQATTVKDKEGNADTQYGKAVEFQGEVWPAGGKLQTEIYGNRLSYIRNVKIPGEYTMELDERGVLHYIFKDGQDIVENDGMCIYVSGDSKPDYRIISIKPYNPLRLEVEKLDCRI